MKIEAEVWEVKNGEIVSLKADDVIFHKHIKIVKKTRVQKPTKQKGIKLTREEMLGMALKDGPSRYCREKYASYIREGLLHDIENYLIAFRTKKQLKRFISKNVGEKSNSTLNRLVRAYLYYLNAKNKLITKKSGKTTKYMSKI